MTNKPYIFVALVAACVLIISSLLFAPMLGIILGALTAGGGLVLQRALDKPEKFAQDYGQADVLNRLWFPLQDELTDVVKTGGRVTEASSAWTMAPGLSKKETPRTFFNGMERYVRQRELVASLAPTELTTEESRQQLVAEQQRLLSSAQVLLEEVNRSISAIPGAETAVRRPRRAPPRPSARRPRPAATRPGVGTRQPASEFRGAPVQTANPARTIRERPATPRPAQTPLRITETSTPPEPTVAPPAPRVPVPPPAPSPRPSPLRITDTPTPPEPTVAPPAPREPVRPFAPSAPPVPPTPVTASVPEPMEPVASTPTPDERESAPTPSAPTGDTPLDVESVCEELFNPNMMSYQTNRLFDDRYKDATVRWRGTTRRASAYSYDFNFGDGEGTKAELDVYEVKQQYGSRTVKAVVQLPVEAADVLGSRMGEDIEFEGRLMTCEGSARRVYVADARMVD